MFCPNCGQENADEARVCVNCGRNLTPAGEVSSMTQPFGSQSQAVTTVQFAGFWRRLIAFVIDAIIVNVVSLVIGFVLGSATGGPFGMQESGSNFIGLVVGWLYWSLQESSSRQATLGKMALGLIVTDMNAMRISWAKATGRHFAKILSALILLIGFIMIGFTEKKQGLHDMLANTLVVRGSAS